MTENEIKNALHKIVRYKHHLYRVVHFVEKGEQEHFGILGYDYDRECVRWIDGPNLETAEIVS